MKKIILLFFVIILGLQTSYAGNKEKDYVINFNGEKYHLLYSVKDKDFGGYLNEYYKHGDTYNIWSELIAVHHFPNAYSPIDRIKDFKDYLSSMNVPSSLTFNDKNNTAIIDFIIIKDNQLPVVMEFNIFKYEKSKKCGSIAIQYAKRYSGTTALQIEEIKKDFEKNRKIMIKKVKKLEIPEVIAEDIDKCISGADVKNEADIVEENQNYNTAENIEATADIEQKNNNTKKEENCDKNQEPAIEDNEINVNNIREQIIDDKQTNESQENDADYSVEETKIELQEDNTNNSIKEEETKIELKNEDTKNGTKTQEDIKSDEENIDIKKQEQNKEKYTKKKHAKNIKIYEISNNKDEFYAVPRSKKDLKKEVKQNRKKQKLAIKQAKKKAKLNKNSKQAK